MPNKELMGVLDAALKYAETRADRGCRHSARFKYQQILPITFKCGYIEASPRDRIGCTADTVSAVAADQAQSVHGFLAGCACGALAARNFALPAVKS